MKVQLMLLYRCHRRREEDRALHQVRGGDDGAGYPLSLSQAAQRNEANPPPAMMVEFIETACNVLQCMPHDLFDMTVFTEAGETLDSALSIRRRRSARWNTTAAAAGTGIHAEGNAEGGQGQRAMSGEGATSPGPRSSRRRCRSRRSSAWRLAGNGEEVLRVQRQCCGAFRWIHLLVQLRDGWAAKVTSLPSNAGSIVFRSSARPRSRPFRASTSTTTPCASVTFATSRCRRWSPPLARSGARTLTRSPISSASTDWFGFASCGHGCQRSVR